MSPTRRSLLLAGVANAAAWCLRGIPAAAAKMPARVLAPADTLDPQSLAAFVDPLPLPPLARAVGKRADPDDASKQLPFHRIEMKPAAVKVHRDLPPTPMWSYQGSVPGPTFEVRSGEGVLVEWVNALPAKHLLPVDFTIHGAEKENPEVRTVVHLHGARAPSESDGYPEAWYPPGQSAICHYPNRQDAAMLWYHDHTLGINRLNVYAGLVGLFFVRDEAEEALRLPSGEYEIPLVVFDRLLRRDGALYYPVSGNPNSPWVPEFFGDAILVNGKFKPYRQVEPRPYRLRIVNASNARFFHFSLSDGLIFAQIGSDQGLLPAPVAQKLLSLAPGERADVVVDFSAVSGKSVTLKNDVLDILQFRIADRAVGAASALPAALRPVPRMAEASAIKTRDLTLDQADGANGEPMTMMLNGLHWCMPITENPVIDTVEIWNLINLTDDSHPIHLHLVRFQILDRRRFAADEYRATKNLRYTGQAMPPAAGDAGWKDTVRADAGMVTRIIVRFEGHTGRFVWHCHILEHEDNEMMRPFQVLPAPPRV